ncbi:two-component system, NtrC family, nitrogen regulation response regulator NtrX/two-component system, sensor histidine kinase ChiS [Mucilaginibacter pineti]|uniref:Two-component system, NtrC family, nitrogen regulation response regulator NtrX/two-component system, sensor histidine kinase ChiS n=1 Tax=Mucilaginibacter pineti TaxID=1391627 RepID=A0A1G7H8V7_9SPHI|nr:response regulator [Mucilaginibacter pineti]SDE96714.1 two-component system, NtrC family, nitrogen regulation response regulator NtrX/two-component system, sensor histidine kinase ChiS [Mucilaginibacter pineti]
MGKILVCDDEQEILDITQLILEDSGHDVTAIINSNEVVSHIENQQPDILLIDLWMPGLSGDQVITQLRTNINIINLPIIVISASKDGRAVAFAAGADDFLEKPYDMDALLIMVAKHLETHRQI